MHRWLGRWFMAIGIVHITYGLIRYREAFAAILSQGLWETLPGHPDRELGFWFVMAGWGMLFGGGLLHRVEVTQLRLPRWIGWAMLVPVVLGIVLVPASGFWALLPPAIAAVIRAQSNPAAAAA